MSDVGHIISWFYNSEISEGPIGASNMPYGSLETVKEDKTNHKEDIVGLPVWFA
jgi:hypothetical protein